MRQRLDEDLASLTGGQAPQDFVRVIQTIFELKQRGDVSEAGALISWLCGSGNVAAAAKKAAGIKGDIGSRDALDYLRGVLEIVKAAGYKGLLIVIDEAETILRMRSRLAAQVAERHPPDRRRRRVATRGCCGSSPARRSSSTPGTAWPASRRCTIASGS